MKYQVKIQTINTVEEIKEYWSNDDYVQLLGKFAYPEASSAKKENLSELLSMAITDFEPNEAAAIVLNYKLSDSLNEGQIQQISNDMLIDKISEEYPEIAMQAPLFNINQLLFKAYNGKFPNAKATIIEFSMTPSKEEATKKLTKENVLKLFSTGLSDRNIIKRLFDDQMHQNAAFPEAENILWDLTTSDDINYKLNTSENWLKSEDFIASEFEGVLEEVAEEA
ncbi:hypothetical protein CXF59_06595 [Flavobacterium sp. ALD4]|uniref:hypothetical protein n=1 Tax=Flavobacterium sp. ALD4 TaxID=2058314 RepID=UPI000C33695D|nr:hypothetical protein [Flavobacterium sp. ALD4]PKH67574.1 hypothetical protein CXF59_06595 [Flavobacterium sp. ALD4]